MRPGPGSDHGAVGAALTLRGFQQDSGLAWLDRLHGGRLDPPAATEKGSAQVRHPPRRVDGVDPAVGEAGVGKAWIQAGLNVGDLLGAVEQVEGDPVLAAQVPFGRTGGEGRGALVHLQLPLLADQVTPTDGAELAFQRGLRAGHERRLCSNPGAVAFRPRGAPEAPQPWHQRQRVPGADCQRPQWVEQPARCPCHDPGRGERKDIAEGKAARVAVTGTAGIVAAAFIAVVNGDGEAFALQGECDVEADDTAADDGEGLSHGGPAGWCRLR